MSAKKIVITGGAGFVGTNLIKYFLEKTKLNIISIDNYSSSSKRNHIKSSRVRYIKAHTKNISTVLNPKKIHSIFHFGEFARIYQSFLQMDKCIDSNSIGTNAVINFCLKNKIKLIYSATSASLGNKGKDKNLSPYAFTKAKNLELLENMKKWFNFKYEIIYFYNVYGPNHIDDTVKICFMAWKKNLCRHYSISHRESFSIIKVAKMFKRKIKYLPRRAGERYASALTNMNLSNKVYKHFGKIKLRDYIKDFIKNN